MAATLLVIAAITIFMPHYYDLMKGFDNVEDDRLPYVTETRIPEQPPIEGSQVVSQLYEVMINDIPIQVDGILFQTDSDVMDNVSEVEPSATYHMDVEINSDGEVNKIIYTKEG